MTIVLIDHALNGENSYYYDGIGKQDTAGWTFPAVTIGEPGDVGAHVEIFAVLVTEQAAAFLDSIESDDAVWRSTVLPGPVLARVEVERNKIAVPC